MTPVGREKAAWDLITQTSVDEEGGGKVVPVKPELDRMFKVQN